MLIGMIKEKFNWSAPVSPVIREEGRRVAEAMDKRVAEMKALTPLCPDGSGRLGHYDPEASAFFGLVYSTDGRWPEKKYFYWHQTTSRGKIIPERSIPEHLKK